MFWVNILTRWEDLKKPVHVTFQKWHFLTRNWESELLPVTPDISCPHSRKASDAGERGAWQHKGSLPPYLQQSTEDGNKPQDKTPPTKNSYMYIICNTGHHYSKFKFWILQDITGSEKLYDQVVKAFDFCHFMSNYWLFYATIKSLFHKIIIFTKCYYIFITRSFIHNKTTNCATVSNHILAQPVCCISFCESVKIVQVVVKWHLLPSRHTEGSWV